MKKVHHFPTGSRFDGCLNESQHCMEGFGVYIFPDGTEYRGYFLNGLFHGFGRMSLGPPYKFIYKGTFDNGYITDIESMTFSDGLRFEAQFDENGVTADNWRYCSPENRRFSTELRQGLEAVGPNSCLTRARNTRKLPPNTYDTEEGLYRPEIGFISDRVPPFKPFRFVGCSQESQEIERTCRKWDDPSDPIEPTAEYSTNIIRTNIKAIDDLGEVPLTCRCNRKPFHFLKKLKRAQARMKDNTLSESDESLATTPSTGRSISSFSEPSMIEDIDQDIENELLSLKVKRYVKETRTSETNQLLEHRGTAIGFSGFRKFATQQKKAD